jgi:GH15 family glucan-1,4-alpha-glucosidase
MVATWIEAAARGRLGGPVRAGMWSTVVVGTHPVEAEQDVWLEVLADDAPLGPLPAYWIENKGVNSLWHVPIPPHPVNVRLKYRSGARHGGLEVAHSAYQEVVVRPNLPDRTEVSSLAMNLEGLVGNRMMTVRIDARGATYDVYYPTVGLHSDVRPAEGDLPQSRSHFRTIVGGLAAGRRLDWFSERLSWDVSQHYQGATNLLMTELVWRHGPIRVLATDFVATGPDLPRTAGSTESPGQSLKRFRITNEGSTPRQGLFGLYVQAEVNGGIGEPGLTWQDTEGTLLATNRGHSHTNRKLARDATVEFAIALDGRGPVFCEPTGAMEAMLLRPLVLPAGETVTVDVLVSGAFTGWRGDTGTFEHWLRPALAWFRAADLDRLEEMTAAAWDEFVEPLPTLRFPRPVYGASLRRSALATAIHCDAKWGAIASGFDRGLHAYCWPRDAIWTGGAMDRAGHPEIGRGVLDWLARVRGKNRPYTYWCQKYTIDGWPEWETPAVDQTALVPWALERHARRTGDTAFIAASWPMIEQAATVCGGASGHPGLRWLDDLGLVSSTGLWDNRFGAFLYSNACVVAGLRAAARLAEALEKPEPASRWRALADHIWEAGILGRSSGAHRAPGLLDPETGRFLDGRRVSLRKGLWTADPQAMVEVSWGIDVSLLGPVVPFGLLPASHPHMQATAEAILKHNVAEGAPSTLVRWASDPAHADARPSPGEAHEHDPSSLATLWMARYLVQLGRETGEGNVWSRALAFLDDILVRLCPLGLALRPGGRRGDDGSPRPTPVPGVWGLHAMLIETLLDLAGLDYDARARRLILDPVLPPAWPKIGLSQPFRCGDLAYQLERPAGSTNYRLTLEGRLEHDVTLDIGVTCPGLPELDWWNARPTGPPPQFDGSNGRVAWTLELPAGEVSCEWGWGA